MHRGYALCFYQKITRSIDHERSGPGEKMKELEAEDLEDKVCTCNTPQEVRYS